MARDAEKNYYSKSELEEFKTLIKKILKEKKGQVNSDKLTFTEHCQSESSKANLFGEQGGLKNTLLQVILHQEKFITALENALIRIDNGTYGICHLTKKLIPKDRLLAVPVTTRCVGAKKAA